MPAKTDITVDTINDRFFISICKKGIHSFVALGVMQNDAPIVLARVGGGLCYKIIQSEGGLYFPDSISYAAYSISYDQYLQFIDLLKLSSKKHDINYSCYLPAVCEDRVVTLKRERITPQSEEPISVDRTKKEKITNASHITPFNTCRHTAIDFLEYTQDTNEATQHVSRFFFYDLLLKNHFHRDRAPDHPFYILPAPPGAHHVGPETKVILTKLYSRMHELLTKDPYGENTRAKFHALEKFYKQQAGSPTDDLEVMLTSIRTWKEEYLVVIKPLRQQSIFGQFLHFFNMTYKSSTESMADEIESSLAQKQLSK